VRGNASQVQLLAGVDKVQASGSEDITPILGLDPAARKSSFKSRFALDIEWGRR
jgi:hypothetical protein